MARAPARLLIAAALVEERGAVIPVPRQTIDELLDQERKHAERHANESLWSLELQVACLESALSALQTTLGRRARQDNRFAEPVCGR